VDEEIVQGWMEVLASDLDDIRDREATDTSGPGFVSPESACQIIVNEHIPDHKLTMREIERGVKIFV
jgi:hypothetical protein